LELWRELVQQVCDVSLNGQGDVFLWILTKDKNFTVASMYKVIMEQGESRRNWFIWKLKLPLKIKIFLWYLNLGVMGLS
jgi:hypothetical protein